VGRIPTLYFFRRKKEKTKQKNRRLYVFALIRKSQSDKAEPRPFPPSAPARFGLVFFVSHYKSYQKIIICSKVFIFIFF
jgi:hypothetical protein